ncbi:MAG: hypothetical protein ABIW38_01345 [Ferruginibacter sp.]
MKKVIQGFLPACALLLSLQACNGDKTTETTDTKMMDSSAMATKPEAPMNVTPAIPSQFTMLEVDFMVNDVATWKAGFAEDSAQRTAAGMHTLAVAQDVNNPKHLQIDMMVDDTARSNAFMKSPELQAHIKKIGVSNAKPALYHVERFDTSSHEKTWVMVTHKVKDFATWLKAFDDETMNKRISEGMHDVVVARGIPDDNTVQVILDITDMAKAKAAITSPDKKQIMMKAGVTSTPVISYWKSLE